MMKMNFTDNQVAFDYVLYMIVGSYFQKAKCTNTLLERRMRLQYCEQKLNTQYQMEEVCIRYMEKKLIKQLPQDLWQQEAEVRFVHHADGKEEIRFCSPKYILRVAGEYKGKSSQLTYELWARG